MKLITCVVACAPLFLLTAACTSETASEPAAEPAPATEPEAVGETSEALVCGVTCKRVGTCTERGPNGTFKGYVYRCTSLSSCGGYSYDTSCLPNHGTSYCAQYGGC